VNSSLSQQFFEAGQELTNASSGSITLTLNEILNRHLGWPFKAATGAAIDLDGQKTSTFGTLNYTTSAAESTAEPVEISADSLACVVDVSETLDLAGLQSAYGRIAQVKRLRKSKAPETKGVPQTTTTLGVIFVANTTVPIETLAEELDHLNRQTPSWQWPDMIVVQSKATINYAVQFPGEKILGDFLPPAEGALAGGVPPMYIIIAMKPTGEHTFNRMCAFIIAHLAIFSPGAALPKWIEILENTPKGVMALCGYQYNLRGDLLPVPRQFYNDRYFPPPPLRIEDPQGNLLSTIQFLPWQDAGVVLLRGKLPLEGLLVFLGKEALKGKITRDGLQISYVLPIAQSDFNVLLQRIQRQSNMRGRNDSTQWIVQKFADEGSSSPFHLMTPREFRTLIDGDYEMIIDDGKGEAADVITIKLDGDAAAPTRIDVEFYHFKYSQAETPGRRIEDLYEVCGQAQKSIAWMSSHDKRTDLFTHILRREARRQEAGKPSRYEKGDGELLLTIREMSRLCPVSLRIFIAQPGLSKAQASREQLELLSVTETYLMETYRLSFGVIASP
jgi:hypothetical protein